MSCKKNSKNIKLCVGPSVCASHDTLRAHHALHVHHLRCAHHPQKLAKLEIGCANGSPKKAAKKLESSAKISRDKTGNWPQTLENRTDKQTGRQTHVHSALALYA